MSEQIEKLYSQLVFPAQMIRQSEGLKIDLSEIAHAAVGDILLKELQSGAWTDEEKQKMRELFEDTNRKYENEQKQKEEIRKVLEKMPQTESEAFFINAKLIHDVNVYDRLNIA